ncbi:hypothetical protein Csa_016703 [Cucumis sativus]|uniref:Uncharacterized protein n=1 Tax=Cucumis sativus TaxID=3659 RepID=A0A0A0K7N8_CUCSA|nr:hypothetical protein Csa_016703 [Cucumis sativus]
MDYVHHKKQTKTTFPAGGSLSRINKIPREYRHFQISQFDKLSHLPSSLQAQENGNKNNPTSPSPSAGRHLPLYIHQQLSLVSQFTRNKRPQHSITIQ